MKPQKREDWPARLTAAIDAARHRPFAWGDHDCALFVADCIDAMCRSAVAARWRGQCDTAQGAAEVLRSAGGVEAIFDGLASEIVTGFMGRGDIVTIRVQGAEAETGAICGVCIGDRIAALSLDGVVFLSRSAALRAWRLAG